MKPTPAELQLLKDARDLCARLAKQDAAKTLSSGEQTILIERLCEARNALTTAHAILTEV
jgi:hypothetical protein